MWFIDRKIDITHDFKHSVYNSYNALNKLITIFNETLWYLNNSNVIERVQKYPNLEIYKYIQICIQIYLYYIKHI